MITDWLISSVYGVNIETLFILSVLRALIAEVMGVVTFVLGFAKFTFS